MSDDPLHDGTDAPPPPGMGAGPPDVCEPPGQEPYFEEAENLEPDDRLADPLITARGTR